MNNLLELTELLLACDMHMMEIFLPNEVSILISIHGRTCAGLRTLLEFVTSTFSSVAKIGTEGQTAEKKVVF